MSFFPISERCSFCGRGVNEVEHLLHGPDGVYICNKCVDRCQLKLLEANIQSSLVPPQEEFKLERLLSPREIMAHLNEYVVGQEQAKRVLSVAVYNHYKRIMHDKDTEGVELDKSNILIVGPTGSGKTLLAQTLARILDVPFCIADATALTEAGYVGEDVENILLRLIQAAGGDIARAEKGIIYIDEIDKVSRKTNDNPSITRDVSGEGVQQALLKIVEGTLANVPPQGGRKHPHQEFLQINTKDILFIAGGTFSGIEDHIARRVGTQSSLGFLETQTREQLDRKDLLRQVNSDDMMKFGLIPEFVGRMPILVNIDPLDRDALIRILTEPKNAITRQYKHLLGLDNVELEFDPSAIGAAADLALERETGARGLRAIIENTLLDVMFEIPGSSDIRKVLVDGDVIRGEAKAHVFREDGSQLTWTAKGHFDPAA
ncbi:MAG TPA: ATP-dependent Clp protease ATP-binding subunit ClpX [Aggregatilineales bacterium]|nr:ATP-dependent Clp protease ATP-binding subunit ClpX [Anaerolineae bacterium]HUN09401.1 ATP-dependent Clp protease ATP-binding subunit ClpX [Aggregatilineales bacterium]